MKKVLIISFLIFIICISFSFNTIFATEINEDEFSNALLNAAQNAANKYNDAMKNTQSKLDELESELDLFLNRYESQLDSNNSNTTTLPQTCSSLVIPSLILFSIFSIIFLTLKIKKYNDIV